MRKFGKSILGIFITLIFLIVLANLTYDPPPESGRTQREIEGEFIAKANALAKELMDADIVHGVKETKILVFPDKWNKLSERERLDFVRTWGRAKKMAQDFERRIDFSSYLDDLSGYPPFMYYDVGNDEFIVRRHCRHFFASISRLSHSVFDSVYQIFTPRKKTILPHKIIKPHNSF